MRKLFLRQKKGINLFSDYPETSQTTWTLSRPSGKYPGNSESFEAIRKLSTIRKISRLSGNSPGYPETFRIIQKISRPSIIRKLSRLSGNFPVQFQGLRAKSCVIIHRYIAKGGNKKQSRAMFLNESGNCVESLI